MINLFDSYTLVSRDLHISMLMAGFKQPAVSIQDDGFLPEDVTSPLEYFLKMNGARLEGKPLYFNQVALPRFWELDANGTEAKIMDKGIQRGRILYTATDNTRLVKNVEWFDKHGRVRIVDSYNQWGWRFARTVRDIAGHDRIITYMTDNGKEVLSQNLVTGNLIYNQPDGKIIIFNNWADATAYYLEHSNLQVNRVMFNSLSTPLFVLLQLKNANNNLLFWQEPITNEIPGNMMFILQGNAGNTKIVVQDRDVYERILSLLPDNTMRDKIVYLGYLYPFARLNKLRKNALIFTNSDNIEQIESIISNLADFQFNIAALTVMSDKLMNLGKKYSNVHLYPAVSPEQIKELVNSNDLYLDINHGDEILDAVRAAFENNMLIMAFDDTMHEPRYIAPENRYLSKNVSTMIDVIKQAFNDPNNLEARIKLQQKHAGEETKEHYQEIIDQWGK